MAYDPQKFINPGQFGDWSNYAGFSDTDQMRSIRDVGKAAVGIPTEDGVPPPETITDAFKERAAQAIAPYQQKFNNLSTAANQLGEGNVFNAYRASQGQSFNPNPKPAQSNEHIYDYGW